MSAINFQISNEKFNFSNSGSFTVPVNILSQTHVKRKGSLFFDQLSLKLYYSDGTQWLEILDTIGGVTSLSSVGGTSIITDGSGPTLEIQGFSARS